MTKSNSEATSTRQQRCPICKSPTAHESRPFCSKRCKDIDLAKWLGEGYAIAGGNDDAGEDGDEGGRGYDPKP